MACQPSAVSTFTELPGPDTPLGRQLAAARTDARLPAVAGVRVTATGELLAHAFGERQASSGDLVTENDLSLIHI